MFTEEWWNVWWPWMLLWLLTAAGLAALVALAAVFLLTRGRRGRDRTLTYSICFYLHDRSVMDHYQMRNHTAALRKEVEQRTSDSSDGTIRAKVFGVSAGSGKKDNKEIVSRYLEVAEPITVIGVIMDVLEAGDAIVHVDLVNQSVRRNAALANAQAATGRPGPAPGLVRLRDIEDFVLIRGRFRKISESADSTVLLAPYGDPEDPSSGPRVRVTCATEGLRNEVPRGTFSARCLGKVQDWNAADAVLEVQAMAIFR
ncbi:hypothetical protein [Streptomyces yaizuensis]|uniref:Uncharacterized protein n=1 Tax=Streptomyces yaizuensis TaxID=2989713 RepID=A0ABQ5P5N5_9ACTN|nr:hypothetical protein [Streptomyces sp. YSPA8]GLF97908.1 hypothetical protein SYYSPA8_26445 [Streptomyces sp. YSPA8]